MKESGIEKLLDLLNEHHHFNSDLIYYGRDEEYEKIYFHSELPEKEKEKLRKAGIYNEEEDGIDEQRIGDEWICSKKFGFISRLVENDKIDRDNINEKTKGDAKVQTQFFGFELYEMVLMLLSISDTPIDDLLLYLK